MKRKWKPAAAEWIAAFTAASRGLGEPRKMFGYQRFEPLPGRVMREYVVAPGVLANEPGALRRWLRTAFGYAGSLPPKAARTHAARSARMHRT